MCFFPVLLLFFFKELVSLGLCNTIGGFFRCYAVASSMSRSLVQESTGCKTQVKQIWMWSHCKSKEKWNRNSAVEFSSSQMFGWNFCTFCRFTFCLGVCLLSDCWDGLLRYCAHYSFENWLLVWRSPQGSTISLLLSLTVVSGIDKMAFCMFL